MSKTYLVVGASSGIGLELVKKLSESGNRVFAVARNERSLSEIPNVEYIPFDVQSNQNFELEADILDGFAYCPGTINLKPFHRLKREEFQQDFDINVLGAVHILQQVLAALKNGAISSVVFFSTVAVAQGMGFHASVASSKGAIEGLTRSLAAELAPTIRVNCIAPSVTNTPLAERLLSSEEKKEASGKRHPLQRVGEPVDIANTAQFLLSEKSNWMTGQVLGVDGGMSTLRML
ncbi:MAG: SDR family oxidoreductase [Cyclobacteriaceae bacterium]